MEHTNRSTPKTLVRIPVRGLVTMTVTPLILGLALLSLEAASPGPFWRPSRVPVPFVVNPANAPAGFAEACRDVRGPKVQREAGASLHEHSEDRPIEGRALGGQVAEGRQAGGPISGHGSPRFEVKGQPPADGPHCVRNPNHRLRHSWLIAFAHHASQGTERRPSGNLTRSGRSGPQVQAQQGFSSAHQKDPRRLARRGGCVGPAWREGQANSNRDELLTTRDRAEATEERLAPNRDPR